MNYRAKRNAKRLSIYTVSSRLGIDYNIYLDIERGKRHLEDERLNKFLKILENSSQIKLERMSKMMKVNEWFESNQARKSLSDFGYTTKSLGKKLGISQSHVSNVFCGKCPKNDDLKERIYDFLNDSLNIRIEFESDKTETCSSKENMKVELGQCTKTHNIDEEKLINELPNDDEVVRLQNENEKLRKLVKAFVKMANKL